MSNITGEGMVITSVEFTTEIACKQAFQEVKKVNDGSVYLRGVCTPKGM
ncbi:hypothetical protein [Trabulsiella odontotermitis]|nr:hypothetical protein [Trabulsiella odontotermitis]